ncbi:MAG: tyrosine-type recombinase/integrase [Candidatus ainarchaeum sp.]|nr:tyrosine-type recombinase/integrase [Candidatus ainarchaeum sp.]
MDEESFAEIYADIDNRLISATKRIEEECVAENSKAITRFMAYLDAKGVSKHQRLKYLNRVGKIGRLLGKTSFKKAGRRDYERVVSELRKSEGGWSLHTACACLRAFFRWLYELESEDRLPDAIKWWKPEKPVNSLRAEDLLSEVEIGKLVAASPSWSWKTLISVAYESGCRPAELLSLRGKDVVFNGKLAKIYVSGKMRNKMGERSVPVVRSYSFLKTHVETLASTESLLFIDKKGKAITPSEYCHALQRFGRKAGVKKKITPYLLRHSRGTQLYRDAGEQIAKKFMGHSADSRMARVYTHLNDEDVERAIMRENGLLQDKKTEFAKCSSCGKAVGYSEKICGGCGFCLATEVVFRNETLKEKIMRLFSKVLDNPKKAERLAELLEKANAY